MNREHGHNPDAWHNLSNGVGILIAIFNRGGSEQFIVFQGHRCIYHRDFAAKDLNQGILPKLPGLSDDMLFQRDADRTC